MLGVFGKNELFAINTAWINLSLGGNSLFHMPLHYGISVLSGNFVYNGYLENLFFTNMSSIMFIINLKELCNFTWKRQIMIISVQRTHSITLHRFHDQL